MRSSLIPLILFLSLSSLFILPVTSIQCTHPLIPSNDGSSCIKPCAGTLVYRPDTRTCVPACMDPRVENKVNGVSVCEEPCQRHQLFNTLTKTCSDICQEPWVEDRQDGIRVCKKPCTTGKYWRKDKKMCYMSCPDPWTETMKDGVRICIKPCENSRQSLWVPNLSSCGQHISMSTIPKTSIFELM